MLTSLGKKRQCAKCLISLILVQGILAKVANGHVPVNICLQQEGGR